MKQSVCRAFMWVAVAAGMMGCSRFGRYNVSIESTNGSDSVQVDIVGVTDAEYELWTGYPLDQYWAPGNAFRRNAKDKLVLRFGMGHTQKQTISVKDSTWKAWSARKCHFLFVLTNAGRFGSGSNSAGDPRRLILPLEKKRWDGRRISIEVGPGGLICINGPERE